MAPRSPSTTPTIHSEGRPAAALHKTLAAATHQTRADGQCGETAQDHSGVLLRQTANFVDRSSDIGVAHRADHVVADSDSLQQPAESARADALADRCRFHRLVRMELTVRIDVIYHS